MRILNVVRERNSEGWSTIDSFLVEDYVVNSEEALRNAVKDYIQSEEGKQDVIDTNGDFNWGDAMMGITDDFLAPYGLRICCNEVETIFVNQDEVLFPEIQDKVLEIE